MGYAFKYCLELLLVFNMIDLKVAIIEPVGGHGGMNYYDFGLLAALKDLGVRATLYTCSVTEVPPVHRSETFCFFVNIYGSTHKLIRFVRFISGLVKSLRHAKSTGVKIVHYHMFSYGVLELTEIVLAKIFGMAIVTTVHDVESFAAGSSLRVLRYIFNKSDAIIVHNIFSKKSITGLGINDISKINIVPSGNYIDFVHKAPSRSNARKFLNISDSSKVTLFFGQIKQVKGLDILLNAWEKTHNAVPESLLLVAGKLWKDDFNVYADLIGNFSSTDMIRLDIRYIPDIEALSFFAAADLVVLPYRRIYQSAVLLMAMSHARAVVVSDLPGMMEVINTGINGFVFSSNDSEDLSAVLISALQDDMKREAVAEAGFVTMNNEYGWHQIGEKTKSVYENVCSKLGLN